MGAFDLVANDCNTTSNPQNAGDCASYDLIAANFYATPERSLRAELSPAWLKSTISTVKYVDKDPTTMDFTTLDQASKANATVCLKDGTFYSEVVTSKFPDAKYLMCPTQDDCLDHLKAERCVLYPDDELQLHYRSTWDPSLAVTREQFNTQYIVWAMKDTIDPVVSRSFKKWLFDAVTNATLDELYFQYFQRALCPVGTAGEKCELPCDPDQGAADARGVCVCISTKWTGEDCSIEVPEEVNAIPIALKYTAFAMLGINVIAIIICGIWLFWKRGTTQVRVSQPCFLVLVLLGCLISSFTIVTLAQEDNGDGPVPACMAIPWLYSVGFSVTFGTLFAKIRRVYVIFKSAADMRRNVVTWQETLSVMGAVLLVDVTILIVWTISDPLEWERTIISADQFGDPLVSEGHCTSEHWTAFGGAIAALHLILLGVACYMCYVSRDIPTNFSEGKYVSIAMVSNLQIFVVGVPILIILGADPQSSFFVRSVIIWMNDLAIVTLIFGNLICNVHWSNEANSEEDITKAVGTAIAQYSSARKERSSRLLSSKAGFSSLAGLESAELRAAHKRLKQHQVEMEAISEVNLHSGDNSTADKEEDSNPQRDSSKPIPGSHQPGDVLKDERQSTGWGRMTITPAMDVIKQRRETQFHDRSTF